MGLWFVDFVLEEEEWILVSMFYFRWQRISRRVFNQFRIFFGKFSCFFKLGCSLRVDFQFGNYYYGNLGCDYLFQLFWLMKKRLWNLFFRLCCRYSEERVFCFILLFCSLGGGFQVSILGFKGIFSFYFYVSGVVFFFFYSNFMIQKYLIIIFIFQKIWMRFLVKVSYGFWCLYRCVLGIRCFR